MKLTQPVRVICNEKVKNRISLHQYSISEKRQSVMGPDGNLIPVSKHKSDMPCIESLIPAVS